MAPLPVDPEVRVNIGSKLSKANLQCPMSLPANSFFFARNWHLHLKHWQLIGPVQLPYLTMYRPNNVHVDADTILYWAITVMSLLTQ